MASYAHKAATPIGTRSNGPSAAKIARNAGRRQRGAWQAKAEAQARHQVSAADLITVTAGHGAEARHSVSATNAISGAQNPPEEGR